MKRICTLLLLAAISLGAYAQRTETLLRDWTFNGKEQVRIPHDWAITGPFDRSIDLQVVAILQNGETEASEKTARSGGLPWIGKGFYECTVDLDKTPGTKCTLLFDGAMSNARVYVNGAFAGEWPYGYNSFYFDVTEFVKAGSNAIRVELENLPGSSRWYPGAGLYRNVHLIQTAETRVPVWGTEITTPEVSPDKALVSVRTEVEGPLAGVTVRTEIVRDGQVLAQSAEIPAAALLEQQLELEHPALWSPETPNLYTAVTILRKDQQEIDRYETVFGVRSISVTAEGGFKLNGQRRQIKGVCLHHDLGPLGAAVNESAIRRQLGILKDMGCDAIRTSHNMPAPELVRLCNELGFMMMLEPFDEWDIAKCENGYHRLFDAWAERDMVNMLRHYRNDPCVVMWSIGNEVPSQGIPGGIETARFLQDICHREDPTRPVTCGMDQVWTVNRNGFAAALDVPGYNYRTHFFLEGIRMLPQGFLLGSETASTVSSRGVYHFPAEKVFSATTPDLQSSSYDEDASSWSNIPDIDFALADDYPWYLGQFVWTGFDYLGEPHPYDTDAWPSHSSYFGIVDLGRTLYQRRLPGRADQADRRSRDRRKPDGRSGRPLPPDVERRPLRTRNGPGGRIRRRRPGSRPRQRGHRRGSFQTGRRGVFHFGRPFLHYRVRAGQGGHSGAHRGQPRPRACTRPRTALQGHRERRCDLSGVFPAAADAPVQRKAHGHRGAHWRTGEGCGHSPQQRSQEN